MRTLIPLLAASLMAGCVASPPPPTTPTAPAVPPASATSSATGLAFDPPVANHTSTPDLSRDPRAPSASNGVVESSTSQFNVTTSVEDNSTNGDFNQSTVTQQSGTVRH